MFTIQHAYVNLSLYRTEDQENTSVSKAIENHFVRFSFIHSYWTFIQRLFKRTTQRRSRLQHG